MQRKRNKRRSFVSVVSDAQLETKQTRFSLPCLASFFYIHYFFLTRASHLHLSLPPPLLLISPLNIHLVLFWPRSVVTQKGQKHICVSFPLFIANISHLSNSPVHPHRFPHQLVIIVPCTANLFSTQSPLTSFICLPECSANCNMLWRPWVRFATIANTRGHGHP